MSDVLITRRAGADAEPGERQPITRSLMGQSISMVLSTVINSGLGMLFWIMAARLYAPEEVGLASALVSGMSLLIGIGHLGLPLALPHILPAARGHARRVVAASYTAATVMSIVSAAVFVAVCLQIPSLAPLFADSPWFVVAFVASVPFCVIFAVQDFVLCALHRASWTPPENFIYSVARFAVLIGLVGWGARGLYLSWSAPAAAVAIVLTVLIYRRVLPAGRTSEPSEAWLTPRTVARMVSSDYAGGLAQTAAIRVLPLIVVVAVGERASAYFYIAWTIMFALDTVLSNVVTAMTVDGANSSSRMRAHVIGVARRASLPLAGCVIAGGLAASFALGLFSADYRAATACLQVLLVSLVPRFVLLVTSAVARHERKAVLLMTLQVVPAVLTVVGALAVGGDITRVAVAYTVAQTLVAIPAAVWLRRWTRLPIPLEAPA